MNMLIGLLVVVDTLVGLLVNILIGLLVVVDRSVGWLLLIGWLGGSLAGRMNRCLVLV